jgi:pre-rRNA-processing protein TSR3
VNIYALEYGQDDPAKCTARKMVQLGLAQRVSPKFHASDSVLVLNPFAHRLVSRLDARAKGILVVDCSWNQVREIFFRKVGGKHRRLPALLAANPTNYAKLGVLSSLEAVAACLYILGEKEETTRYLNIYKWGPTFETLNKEPLESYNSARSEGEILELEPQYFPQLAQDSRKP